VHSNPDIVLVDEVLAVGDAGFRRRAVESLRELIASGKTVLFISHDIWSVRRLCERIIWMDDGAIRASGASADVAEQYMNEVNLRALGNQHNALSSHRAGTGEVRCVGISISEAGEGQPAIVSSTLPLTARVSYQTTRSLSDVVFQLSIVDVDTGVVVTTATSRPIDLVLAEAGAVDCTFDPLPLRRRQYVLQLVITDRQHAVSYDVVSAGPRFTMAAVSGSASDDDLGGLGLIAVPYRFEQRARVAS
jgi:ABC-type sulfate/molybdate transport systems ATPase subunit